MSRKNDEVFTEKTRSRPVSTNLETAIDMPPALPDVPKEKIGEGYGSESGCGSSGLVTIIQFFALSNFFREIQLQIYHRGAFWLGLIRVDHLVYPPLTRPRGPLPDLYPNPGGYPIPRATKRIKNNEFEWKKSEFLVTQGTLKCFGTILICVLVKKLLYWWFNWLS